METSSKQTKVNHNFVTDRIVISCGGRRREYWQVWWFGGLDEWWQPWIVLSKLCSSDYEGEEVKIPGPVVADVVSEGDVPAFFYHYQPFLHEFL